MVPEFIPNFLATLSHPPWTGGLRWGLCVTQQGEERVLFSSYVQHQPVAPDTLCPVESFPQFSRLPTELQFRILSFCSARILFQAMRASSTLRIEASKLFWAHPEAYFLVPAHWLLDGGYPGFVNSDLLFLRHVHNVFVDCDGGLEHEICPSYDEVAMVQQGHIDTFWESLTRTCPSAKRVMLHHHWEPRWPGHKTLPVPHALRFLAQQTPLHMTTTALIVEEIGKNATAHPGVPVAPTQQWQRSFYQALPGGAWEPVPCAWPWKIILPPTKPLEGPVGQYMALAHKTDIVLLELDGLWPLMVEALDRHHFHNGKNEPFSCPSPDCSAYFAQAGEWTVHAAEVHYNDWVVGDRFSILPPRLKRESEQRARALEVQLDQLSQSAQKICANWHGHGGGEQEEIERAWMAQLKNDRTWDTGTTPRASRLWKAFLQDMCAATATANE
ncbi:hypothetical protein BKA63DRAFT_73530 [Paraphoma chrysanthemicola]|nr:hypothetical protein BKA63DRAFT_73530 [Paraphoma chrysanthemicola]